MLRHKFFLCCFFTLVLLGCTPKVDEVVIPEGHETNKVSLPSNGIHPLQNEQHLDLLLEDIGNVSFVLLGAASSGTAEFFKWRAAITRRLIEEKGFKVVAIEGDWPASFALNQYAKGNQQFQALPLNKFERWPDWKWANQEMAGFSGWLQAHNSKLSPEAQVSFYGLDVYGLWDAVENLRQDFKQADAQTLAVIEQAWNCLGPYNRNVKAYAQTSRSGGGCARELADLYAAVQRQAKNLSPSEHMLNVVQNAALALNAHKYLQATQLSNLQAWNVRQEHMMTTLERLVSHYGPETKIVVWADNEQVGDARYSNMIQGGMSNLGQVLREKYEKKGVYLVGSGTYQGQVLASSHWDGPRMTMSLPQAVAGSWESLFHQKDASDKLVLLREWRSDDELAKFRGLREIGPVYSPYQEAGNYVPCNFPNRYDAFLYLDKTSALEPL